MYISWEMKLIEKKIYIHIYLKKGKYTYSMPIIPNKIGQILS